MKTLTPNLVTLLLVRVILARRPYFRGLTCALPILHAVPTNTFGMGMRQRIMQDVGPDLSP